MKRLVFILTTFCVVGFTAFSEIVHVQLLGINDFHGNLEPPLGSTGKINGIDAGGIEYLATHIKSLRQGHPYSVTVSAGDLFGASPLLSAMFHDEPTILAMDLLKLDLNAVGNHEFDKGWKELERLKYGDKDGDFKGAHFDFLAANVIVDEREKTLFEGYQIREFGSVKIAFIGLVLEGIDKVVIANGIKGLTFLDEADTVNALIPTLQEQGVSTIVVLIHEGGFPTGGYNECPGISGPIVEIVNRLSDKVGVVLSGHTHQAYNCIINNKLVTSSASNGRLVTNIDLAIDHEKGLLFASADNLIVTRDVKKDADQSKLIETYKEKSSLIANKVIAKINQTISKEPGENGESVLGRLIADAQVQSTWSLPDHEKAQIAFMNPGGIRTDVTYESSPANEGDGNVTFSEAFSVQPFGNNIISMELTGAQILEILEQQFEGCGFFKKRILQISRELSYSVSKNAPPCHKIIPNSVMINEKPLEENALYRIVANSFLADGGDGFTAFKKGINRITQIIDLDAFTTYLENNSPIIAPLSPRIIILP